MDLVWRAVAASAGAVGIAGENEYFGMMRQAGDHRGGDDVFGEDLAPASEGRLLAIVMEACSYRDVTNWKYGFAAT